MFIPFIKFSKQKELNGMIIRWIGIISLIYMVVFTIKGYL